MTKAPKIEIAKDVDPMKDRLTIVHVANGWIIKAGDQLTITANEFTHVAVTPDDLAKHIRKWALAQTSLEEFTLSGE